MGDESSASRGADRGTNTPYHYPYATSPDIIRANQKDAYFQALLHEHLSTILRNIKGARFLHSYSTEAKALADTLYFVLTTLVGNRTLGEEYCDIVQVEAGSAARLPSVRVRAAYIGSAILVPYLLNRTLPKLRRTLRAALERSLAIAAAKRRRPSSSSTTTTDKQKPTHQQRRLSISKTPTWSFKIQRYMLDNLDTLTSPAPVYAVSLATFYFTGAYYHLSKRLLGLRYIFTRNLPPSSQRAGYEVLGVLLLLQLSVQSYLHLRNTVATSSHNDLDVSATGTGPLGTSSAIAETLGGAEVSLDPNAYSANNALLFSSASAATPPPPPTAYTSSSDPDEVLRRISAMTNTPSATQPHIDLSQPMQHQPAPPTTDDEPQKGKQTSKQQQQAASTPAPLPMRWLKGRQARKCTLCLEPMKDPSATLCGHVFCWTCICDWLRGEKAECPLCRQGCAVQHVLPLR